MYEIYSLIPSIEHKQELSEKDKDLEELKMTSKQ